MTEDESLWSALMRRRVVRSIALYLASAWLVIQVASLIAGIWSMPAGFVQDLFVLLVIGAPIVAIVSWIYDLGSGGLERTRAGGFGELLRGELRGHPWRSAAAVLGLTVSGLIAVAYAWPDEELGAQARRLSRFATHAGDETLNINYGEFGFYAPEGADIWDHGRLVLRNYMTLGTSLPEGPGTGFSVDDHTVCELRERGCADRLIAAVDGVPRLLEANAVPLARYRELHAASAFGYPLEGSSPDDPYPSYSNLRMAARLEVLDALHEDAVGEYASAMQRLERELGFHRRMLARSSLIITKMVAIALVQNDVRAMALITERAAHRADRAGFPPSAAARITEAERSMIEPMGSEAVWMIRWVTRATNREGLSVMTSWHSPMQRAAFQLLPMRRNVTLNRWLEDMIDVVRASQLTAAAFAAQPPPPPRSPGLFDLYTNAAGEILLSDRIDFLGYVERCHDLDALIVLARVAHRLHAERVPEAAVAGELLALPPELRDPFTGEPPQWIDQELRFARAQAKERRVEPWLPFTPQAINRVN